MPFCAPDFENGWQGNPAARTSWGRTVGATPPSPASSVMSPSGSMPQFCS